MKKFLGVGGLRPRLSSVVVGELFDFLRSLMEFSSDCRVGSLARCAGLAGIRASRHRRGNECVNLPLFVADTNLRRQNFEPCSNFLQVLAAAVARHRRGRNFAPSGRWRRVGSLLLRLADAARRIALASQTRLPASDGESVAGIVP